MQPAVSCVIGYYLSAGVLEIWTLDLTSANCFVLNWIVIVCASGWLKAILALALAASEALGSFLLRLLAVFALALASPEPGYSGLSSGCIRGPLLLAEEAWASCHGDLGSGCIIALVCISGSWRLAVVALFQAASEPRVISPDFSLELTGFFPGKHLIHFLVLKMKDFRNFVLDNCILDFDAEQVYLKLQVINLKNKEVTVNPKPQTLEKNWFFENPKP